MDAAIVEGKSLRLGAVAAVSSIKNPVRLARRIMEDGRHVMLAAEGALLFAREIGFPECAPDALIVESARKLWQERHGTVGCVAMDASGVIAAATSTGGIFNKRPGRVGDSPQLGCGTYADDCSGVSCTGHGEAIIRVLLARSAAEFIRAGADAGGAAARAVTLLAQKTGSTGGLIIVDTGGRIGYARNTTHMPVCYIREGKCQTDS
jgi:beta-aspartyl-peptidase (threonine type)